MKIFLTTIVLLSILIVSCQNDILEELKCDSDDDCVQASCCHADSCVNKDFKPECTGILCSMDCKPGTMDCGQGRCGCESNKCTAIIG
ncbi:hypothetical protein CMO90_02295 [Candidatus Woesearchaeota archaeon]|jgi:hypothetical protein|nr:hypothetical protein [Candidatus Woesearchaeota archaeon]